MFSFLNNQISLFYKKEKLMKLLLDDKTKRAGASFIIFSKEKKEFWIVGDCQMIIDDKYYSFKKKIDCILSNIRSLVNNNYLLEGLIVDDLQSKDYGREFILPILRKQSL
jgi:glycerophosphoryl diester phosphodiesterase